MKALGAMQMGGIEVGNKEAELFESIRKIVSVPR